MNEDRATIEIPRDLHKRLSIRAVTEEKPIKELAAELIAFGLGNKKIIQSEKRK